VLQAPVLLVTVLPLVGVLVAMALSVPAEVVLWGVA
jgi:hypothetical protein